MSEEQKSFNTRLTTVWILLIVTSLLIAWDFYARHFNGGTISEVALTWARSHPVVPFLVGVVCGHLFWPQLVNQQKGD